MNMQIINTFKLQIMDGNKQVRRLSSEGLLHMAREHPEKIEASGGVSTLIEVIKLTNVDADFLKIVL
jgi:hypothetical protein